MKRQITIDGGVARIPLTQGMEAIIDADDVGLVSGFNWTVMRVGRTAYAKRNDTRGGTQKTVLLHRVIIGAAKTDCVDHRNGNGLDCRRENLRLASKPQNNRNTRMHRDNRIGFKGVCKHFSRYSASIQVNGQKQYLGMFATAEDAHAAYCAASAIYHGEFGRTA